MPGTAFYPDGRGRQQMRLAFCYPTEDRIAEGVRRLGELSRTRRSSTGRCRDDDGSPSSPAGGRPSATSRSARAIASPTALAAAGTTRVLIDPAERAVRRERFHCKGFGVLRRPARQGGRGRHRPAPARAAGHRRTRARARDRVSSRSTRSSRRRRSTRRASRRPPGPRSRRRRFATSPPGPASAPRRRPRRSALVVKPSRAGSAMGLSFVDRERDLPARGHERAVVRRRGGHRTSRRRARGGRRA